MQGIRRKIGAAVGAGVLLLAVSGSASAATSGWYYSDTSYVKFGSCRHTMDIGTNNASVSEEGSNGCPGNVYAQAMWTNGQSTYPTAWSLPASETAIAGQFLTVGVRGMR